MDLLLPTAEDIARIDVEIARRMSLAEFVQESWPVLERSTPLIWNWHIDAICDHVQFVLEGWASAVRGGPTYDVQKLKVQIPPGCMKSRVLSVCAPAWMWIRDPSWSVICLSANPRVALRDAVFARRIIESDWYQETFRPEWKLLDDQNAKSNYMNTEGGRRQSAGWEAGVTGDRAAAIIIDDPIDAKNLTAAALEKVNRDYDEAVQNRLSDMTIGNIFLIMQRLAVNDLVGHTDDQPGWEQICLAQEFELGRKCVTWTGWEDPRTEEGELLFEGKFPRAIIDQQKEILGPAGYAAQHLQRPAPRVGKLFQRAWFQKRWCTETLPQRWDFLWMSVDPANAEKPTSWVVLQLWGLIKGERYLLDQVRGRFSPMNTEQTILDARARWGQQYRPLNAIEVEAKAAGPAVMERLRHVIAGVTGKIPKGSKEERALGVAPQLESGNVWIPDPSMPGFGWVLDMIEELVTFPQPGGHDDQVDALTQALEYAQGHTAKVLSLSKDFAQKGAMVNRFSTSSTSREDGASGGNRFRWDA